jgi:hypothetical protein
MTASIQLAERARSVHPDPRRPIGIEPFNASQPPVDIDFRPRTVNLRNVYEGDDTPWNLIVTSSATGELIDLTGAVPRAQMRVNPDDENVLVELDCAIATDRTGVVTIMLPSAVNVGKPDRAVWDCQITVQGYIITIAAGEVVWTQEVTRP